MSNDNTGGEGFIIALVIMIAAGVLKATGHKVSWWWIILPIPIYIASVILFVLMMIGTAHMIRG